MSTIQILHNPRCSKSRQTLELLQAQGLSPEVIDYLNQPLNKAQIESLSAKLGLQPSEFVRKAEFAKLGIQPEPTEQGLVRQMVEYPILIERPIVINGQQARVGRPPESVLEIL